MKTLLPGGPGGKGGGGKTATQRKSVKVSDARGILEEAEIDRRLAGIDMKREAITCVRGGGAGAPGLVAPASLLLLA